MCIYKCTFKISNTESDLAINQKSVYEDHDQQKESCKSFKLKWGWCPFLPASLSEELVYIQPCPQDMGWYPFA